MPLHGPYTGNYPRALLRCPCAPGGAAWAGRGLSRFRPGGRFLRTRCPPPPLQRCLGACVCASVQGPNGFLILFQSSGLLGDPLWVLPLSYG